MSDGPYQSLPLRKPWREAAEFAHKEAFSSDERSDAICAAMHNDLKEDVGLDRLKAIGSILLQDEQGSLFADQADSELDAIRDQYAPSSLMDAIIEHAQYCIRSGLSGDQALEAAINRASLDNAHANARSIEEHYLRDGAGMKGSEVRSNLNEALSSSRAQNIGREVIALMKGENVETKVRKATGIDEGLTIEP